MVGAVNNGVNENWVLALKDENPALMVHRGRTLFWFSRFRLPVHEKQRTTSKTALAVPADNNPAWHRGQAL